MSGVLVRCNLLQPCVTAGGAVAMAAANNNKQRIMHDHVVMLQSMQMLGPYRLVVWAHRLYRLAPS